MKKCTRKRIIRKARLAPDEAAKYEALRAQIEAEFPKETAPRGDEPREAEGGIRRRASANAATLKRRT